MLMRTSEIRGSAARASTRHRARAHAPAVPRAHAPRSSPGAQCACGGGCPRCSGGFGNVVASGLAAPAHALPAAEQQPLERRFGRDLSLLRIHAGPAAAASADALGARAYTVGSHVVLGRDARPAAHDPTLVHETAHAVQQDLAEPSALHDLALVPAHSAAEREADRARHGAPVSLRTSVAVARDQPAAQPTFAQVWGQFVIEKTMVSPLARELALQALELMTEPSDRRAHGLTLVTFLLSQGMTGPAQRALQSTRDAWMLAHVTVGGGVPHMAGIGGLAGGPEQLIPHAETAARADRHELAFTLFGTAFQLLSWQVSEAGPRRERELSPEGRGPAAADITRTMFHYPLVKDAYDQMRRILGFYRTLEAEQRRAGNAQLAGYYSGLALHLYWHIRDNYIWSSDAGMIAEVQRVTHPAGGEALRIYGENLANIDVTQLPGLPPPREVTGAGEYTFQHQSMEGIAEALYEQTELQAELQAEPAIQAEFGVSPIDFNDLGQRLRVWRTMYRVYQQRDTLGFGALYRLMDLIGRYLRAYTVHTSYNIGDFGRSYLENQMRDFPTDLVGRVERDCGVYALTVAYEVFRTAREATPRLPVEFRLFAMPEHVTLVIFDRSQNNYYIVNNDRVSPPRQGDIMEDVARAYAPIPGRRNLVTPSMEFELGSTALSNSQFRSRAWSRYLDGASWGIHVPPPQPGDTSAPAELRERAYREFYAAQRFYDESTPELHELVDNLVAAIANLSPADRLARLRTDIPTLSRLAADVGLAFERAGPFAQLDTARPDAALLPRLRTAQRFLFLSDRPGRPTALVRAAMALLHFAHEGGTLSPVEQAIIALCDRVPAFHATLDTYRQHGFPAEF